MVITLVYVMNKATPFPILSEDFLQNSCKTEQNIVSLHSIKHQQRYENHYHQQRKK